jgi:hypothetical protein
MILAVVGVVVALLCVWTGEHGQTREVESAHVAVTSVSASVIPEADSTGAAGDASDMSGPLCALGILCGFIIMAVARRLIRPATFISRHGKMRRLIFVVAAVLPAPLPPATPIQLGVCRT